MPLCEVCLALRCVSWQGPGDFLVDHHRSYADLQASAQAGCSLCILLRRGLLQQECNNHDSNADETGQSDEPPETRRQEAERTLHAKAEPFYLQRVYSTVNGSGGIHGFEYCQGTFDPSPSRIRRINAIPPAFITTTGPGNSPDAFFHSESSVFKS
jgi:hypothetical protein